MKYLQQKLPNTPKYVIKDLIYQCFKPYFRGEEGYWNWDDLNLSWEDFGPLDQIIWTSKPQKTIFNLKMFNQWTKEKLAQRAGGKPHPDFKVPRDAERHIIQASRLGPKDLAFKEPVILFRKDNGEYELLEGWHRVIQAFAKYGDGFQGMAYVGRKGSKSS